MVVRARASEGLISYSRPTSLIQRWVICHSIVLGRSHGYSGKYVHWDFCYCTKHRLLAHIIDSTVYLYVHCSGDWLWGALALTAVGIDAAGSPVFSQPVVIRDEPSKPVTALSVSPTQIAFSFAGEQLPLIVTGSFEDGSMADVTQFSQIRYASGDTNIVQAATAGLLTAVGPGTTKVTASYGSQNAVVAVSVPNTIR
jgi:hypothetical protein